ncbi:hypothetical protein RQP46_002425 [Phenoliferia psychrophenolica]
MTDSITPWINSAALAHISTYDTLMPDTSTSYEHGGHVQLLKITSDPYCPHGVWCEFSDREVIVNAFVPREEIDAFNLSSAEKFLEQQYGVFTIKRYRWHAWQPAFAKRRVGNEETEYEKRARRVCMLVIDMELLAPSLGGPVSDAGGKHPKELARSREADVRSWNERCVERWFEDLTIEVNAGRRRRKEEELTMEEVRKEEDDLRVPPVVVAHEVEDVKPVITRGEVVRAPSAKPFVMKSLSPTFQSGPERWSLQLHSDDSDNAGEEVFHHLTGTHSSGPEPEPEPDNNNNNFLFNFSNEDDEEELLPTQLDEPTQLPSSPTGTD